MTGVMTKLAPYSEIEDPYDVDKRRELRKILDGLELKVLTQNRYMNLWRGIQTQLGFVGVTLDIERGEKRETDF